MSGEGWAKLLVLRLSAGVGPCPRHPHVASLAAGQLAPLLPLLGSSGPGVTKGDSGDQLQQARHSEMVRVYGCLQSV